MKVLLRLLVILPITTLFASETENHANFHWTDCPAETTADQCLKVDFASDKTDDVALLHYVDDEITVLSGHLMKDTAQSIAVTVYKDHMEITLHSSHDAEHSMFRVDLESGTTSVIEMPTDIVFDDSPLTPNGFNNSAEIDHYQETITTRKLSSRRFVPSKGYNLRVAFFYDNYFLAMNGNSHSAAQTMVTSIFNHVKTIFSQLTVSGVAGAIVPTLASTNHRSGYWNADQYLSTVSMISNGLQWDVDDHVYLTYQGNARGVVGMAYIGSVCSVYQYYRSNINEYYHTDTITAQIVAHEIGHNLGMSHDFTGNRWNRYEGGQACTNIGGYMDYTSSPNKWSPCSVGDFTRYYSWVSRRGQSDGYRPARPFCLQESTEGGGSGTSCIQTCTNSWTGATPSCITDDLKTAACTEACSAAGATCA